MWKFDRNLVVAEEDAHSGLGTGSEGLGWQPSVVVQETRKSDCCPMTLSVRGFDWSLQGSPEKITQPLQVPAQRHLTGLLDSFS